MSNGVDPIKDFCNLYCLSRLYDYLLFSVYHN